MKWKKLFLANFTAAKPHLGTTTLSASEELWFSGQSHHWACFPEPKRNGVFCNKSVALFIISPNISKSSSNVTGFICFTFASLFL